MDEGADASPSKPGYPFDRLLVMVDAVVSGRLRRVEAGQQKG
jgi:hypothetical protein